jgi:phosphotransferase system HPr (HPr) family protein
MPPNSDTAEATVVLPAHLHARPAGALAQTAARFHSTIEITHNGKTANPTGILAVMSLGATAGTTITIRANGTDADRAITEITQLLSTID